MEVVTSILDAPLDDYITEDEGDIDPQPMPRALEMATQSSAPVYIIPYTRPLKLDSVGKDVIGAKRAIWKANGLKIPVNATPKFGSVADQELRKFQEAHSLKVDGVLGRMTLCKLAPYFDADAFLLYTGYPPGGSKEKQTRNAIVAYAVWGYNQRALIYYAEFRPMTHMDDLMYLPVTEDCSTYCTKGYKYGKAPDPNGMNYNGYGNTVSMRAHGTIVTLDKAKPADLVHYDGPQHVAFYVGNDRVISHGSTDGPLLSPINYRPVRYLRKYL